MEDPNLRHLHIQRGPPNDVLVDKFNIEIKREDLQKLKPGRWLNDELINFYVELLMERSKKTATTCHFFNTHFFSLLTNRGKGYVFSKVAKWTKSVGDL